MIGAVISLVLLIRRASRPHVAFLGRIAGTRRFSDRERHPDNELIPGVLIFRPEASLLYFNMDHVRDTIAERVRAEATPPKLVVLDLSAAPYVDMHAAHMLAELAGELTAAASACRRWRRGPPCATGCAAKGWRRNSAASTGSPPSPTRWTASAKADAGDRGMNCKQAAVMLSVIAHRRCSGGRHGGRACRRLCPAVAVLDEIARRAADTSLAHHLAAHPRDVAADPDPCGRDRGLGVVLSVGGMPARCRVGVLFFRGHLRDDWLRRSGVAEAVADARPGRGADRHSHVRIVRRPFLRGGQQDLHVALGAKTPE